jgi:translation initiation factor 5B
MSTVAERLRQPVVVVLGHVDSGKTSLLDRIRGTGVQAREAGGITQEIGASFFPLETLKAICGPLLIKTGGELKIPGLLVIDTPGHEIFSNLRNRGGSAADIAILVVDVQKGIENQTVESIEILKQRKVPFVVALNKIDMIKGWKKESKGPLAEVLKQLSPEWNDELEERLYNVVGRLSLLGFEAELFFRVQDFKKQVSIVPVSARYGVGIPELLAVLIGLAQQFLKGKLIVVDQSGRARGMILELQEETGVGWTANVILTEGRLRVGADVVLLKREGAHSSKIKALFMPKPLDEMRDPRDKFTSVGEVYAAAGVKLVTPDLEGVLAGSPVIGYSSEDEFTRAKDEVEKELRAIITTRENMGVVVKASSIGGLEALLGLLKDKGIPVRQADIGDISRKDIVEAQVVAEHDPYLAVILAFEVKVLPDAREHAKEIQIFKSNVIYEVIDAYMDWATKKRAEDERMAFSAVTPPAKLKVLPGTFFRRKDPAIFGVQILAGRIRPKTRLMNEGGEEVGSISQIQDKGKTLEEAKIGAEVAVSVPGPTLGRQIREGDVLYAYPSSYEVKLLRKKFLPVLGQQDLLALEEITRIRSRKDVMYGY